MKKIIILSLLLMFTIPIVNAETNTTVIVKSANCPKCNKGILLPFSGLRGHSGHARWTPIVFDGYKCTKCGYKFNWR